jgi:hypothetical protein
LQFLDHLSHRLHGEISRTLAADHQTVGVVDDDGSQPLPRARLLPPQHQPSHVQVRQQRRDRGALRNAAMLIPISRGSMFSSAIVRLFHRRLDPHLDQVQDLPVGDPARHRFHQ